MYAVVVRETGQREAIEGSEDLLKTNLLPRVREAPGVVSASFMSDGDGATLNVLVFESEEAARAALQTHPQCPTSRVPRAGERRPLPGARALLMTRPRDIGER